MLHSNSNGMNTGIRMPASRGRIKSQCIAFDYFEGWSIWRNCALRRGDMQDFERAEQLVLRVGFLCVASSGRTDRA